MTKTVQFQGQTITQEEAVARLQALSREGLKNRCPFSPAERLTHELGQIAQDEDCLQRFIILWDLARYAREHQIYIGPGQGTLPGSLTAYCLGITEADPIRYNLLFERFLPRKDGRFPSGMYLCIPARAQAELSSYLSAAYPGECPSDVLYVDYTVSRVDLALRLIAEATGIRPDLSFIDIDDKKVYELLSADEVQTTFCVFDHDSPFLTEIQPRSIEELTAAAAFQVRDLFEPDPLYGHYLARGKNPEQPDQAHQIDYLKDTRGSLLYLEQIMFLLRELTGCSLEQAAVQIRKLRELPRDNDSTADPLPICLNPLFCLDPKTGEQIPLSAEPDGQLNCPGPDGDVPVPLLAGIAHRAVGKSHFLSTAILSYQVAYLQCYYPEAFQKACSAVPEPDFSDFPV